MSKKSSKKPVKKPALKAIPKPAAVPNEDPEALKKIESEMRALVTMSLLAISPHYKAMIIIQRREGHFGFLQGTDDFTFDDAQRWLDEVTKKAPSA